MAIAVATTRQALANAYAGLGAYLGVTTGAPGSGPAVANEASGGSPAYARKATSWASGSGGTVTGSATTIDLPAGTYTHAILCSGVSGSNMIDWANPTDVVLTGQGQLIITPTYTQT
jgi:hypothetical protein